jgi:hypothetical protein
MAGSPIPSNGVLHEFYAISLICASFSEEIDFSKVENNFLK